MMNTMQDKQQQKIANLLELMPPMHWMPPKLARPTFTVIDRILGIPNTQLNTIKNVTIPTHDGKSAINARIYYPNETKACANTTHAMMYFHGGGCVIGSINSHDRLCRYFAQNSNVVIISVNYRLAPEHKIPTPIVDAITAWNWLNDNKHALGLENHILGAGGDSAGAYLTTLLSLTDTQQELPINTNTPPAFQYLLYPMIDLRGQTESYRNANKGMLLTSKLMDYFSKHYLQSVSQKASAIASPALANDLHLLPKTYLLTVEFDPLKDDGIAFANTLKEKNIPITHEHFEDCMHSFVTTYKVSERAKQACKQIARQLKHLCST